MLFSIVPIQSLDYSYITSIRDLHLVSLCLFWGGSPGYDVRPSGYERGPAALDMPKYDFRWVEG